MTIGIADRWGVPVRGSNHLGVARLDDAVEQLVALAGAPRAAAEAAVEADHELALGQIFLAYLSLYAASAEGLAAAGKALEGVDDADSALDQRERLHLRAARAWAAGEWESATHWLEQALLCHPGDLLALRVAQDLYFFLGNQRQLRDVAARVLPAWLPDQPGWGYVQGMYAFGLEENASYRQAEAFAGAALDAHPGDVWAVHAMAHVFEMEGSQRQGVAFLTETAGRWSDSYFAPHNWWHRALYHLELGEIDLVLDLYDRHIRITGATEWLDLVDAASLLWRLWLFGIDVDERARALTADIQPLIGQPIYVFNDWHAAMTFGMAGRDDLNRQLMDANRRGALGTNQTVLERVGLTLLEGFMAFGAGQTDRAIELLVDLRPAAQAVGGSHAQRDVIDLTLLAAAARTDDRSLVRALTAERVAGKPSAADAIRQVVAANRR
jgi:tetratricopeptide (TPR) repeat protein